MALGALFLAASCALAGEMPAFPGAEGWGADTRAGRGGKVIIVDNLNDAGPGSLRAALQETGRRIIVFRVSGVIKLEKKDAVNRYIDLREKHSEFMVAGQTSPGGVTLFGDRKAITGCYKQNLHDFVFRHLRFRVQAAGNIEGIDGAEFNGASNFVLDHCDFSGGTDGTLDITSGKNYTVQWCTVANSFYVGGDHGGSLLAYAPTHHVTLHHNIWAHHQSRCGAWFHWSEQHPEHNGLIDYRNNLCYNAINYMFVVKGQAPVHVNVVGNSFITGPNTPKSSPKVKKIWKQVSLPTSTVYEADNLTFDEKGEVDELGKVRKFYQERVEKPHEMPAVTTSSAKQAYEDVLGGAGAWPRDPMTERVVKEIRTRTGKVRNHEAPCIEKGPEPPADSDLDGMPDFWEEGMKLNPRDASDAVKDQDGDGYTNIEEYINDLALARMKQDYHNPVYPVPKGWPDHDPKSCKQIGGK
jgi:pectate lyase